MQTDSKPLVAIVGRPNVGKSTLFNRIAGRPWSIVSHVPGTTRDRVTTETVWADYPFILVDTGGLHQTPDTDISHQVRGQVDVAISEADVIVMLVDAHAGVTASDTDVADANRIRHGPASDTFRMCPMQVCPNADCIRRGLPIGIRCVVCPARIVSGADVSESNELCPARIRPGHIPSVSDP